MIGSKGLPSVFGGIERHVEQTGRRLVERGHEVTVFGRRPFGMKGRCQGMDVEVLPSIPTKNFDTATNALFASIAAVRRNFDIVHFHGIGPSIFCWIPKSAGRKTVATIHALDYRQKKWGAAAAHLLEKGESCAVRKADVAIAVSKLMKTGLEKKYGRELVYIPNGATVQEAPAFRDAAGIGVEPGKYILTVGRFIVERGFDTLLKAFARAETGLKLVIAGDERFAAGYTRRLRSLAGNDVIFPGYISGRKLDELYAHCLFYVLPSLVEGLPISLLEAMSYSRPALISDIPENMEVAAGIAEVFRAGDEDDLVRAIGSITGLERTELDRMGRAGRDRVLEEYTWDSVTDRLEKVYLQLYQ